MKAISTIALSFLLCCCNKPHEAETKAHSKKFEHYLEEAVLSEKNLGISYSTKVNDSKNILEYEIAYIGEISTTTSGNLLFLYSTVYSGIYEDAKHANSKIVVYNSANERLGHYYVGGNYYNLSISKNNLLTIKEENCNQLTTFSFRDSIPKEIFIHCTENQGKMFGDIYTFTREE